ncbi:unnamed protein product [Gongylonema pulchrum]|uniref:Zf-Tim10_DDP domain-containing protein n=1 Tax=Gongylonema pulchrum TaxID=637853 RepID=A0A183D2K2_9BILA|nr:unnamed protein product [Gongylonema pulchrum]
MCRPEECFDERMDETIDSDRPCISACILRTREIIRRAGRYCVTVADSKLLVQQAVVPLERVAQKQKKNPGAEDSFIW